MTTSRNVDLIPPEPPPYGLPSILELIYGIRKYDPPLRRFTAVFQITLYNDAVEFIIKTDKPIPIQATSPALFIGEKAVLDGELLEPLSYTFRLFDYENLPDKAIIYWGWSHAPSHKMVTSFQFNKQDIIRF